MRSANCSALGKALVQGKEYKNECSIACQCQLFDLPWNHITIDTEEEALYSVE